MKAAITPYGAACFGGSDTIRILCKADEARHIVHCVNNHERLVALAKDIQEDIAETGEVQPDTCASLDELLAALEAEKGGE